SHRFTFRNDGPEHVEITDVRTSCGCLVPRLVKRDLNVGEEGSLLMEVNSLTLTPGSHTWKVNVRYQCGARTVEVPLQVTAAVVAQVTVQPAALTICTEGGATQQLQLTDLRSQPLSVTSVQTSTPGLRASLSDVARDSLGHWVRKINVEVTADYP